MEVTYLRLDPVQPEIDIFNKHISQQIVYSSTNQYGTDVIILKTLPMKPNGITLGRNQFWSENMPHLLRAIVKPFWSNGQAKVSVYSVTLPQGHMIIYTHNVSFFGEIRPYTKLIFIRNSGELTTYAYGLSLLTLDDQVMYDTDQCDDPNAELQFLKLFETHLEQEAL